MPSPPATERYAPLALDLRSLAVLRAGSGSFLLIDALWRLASAGLLYADIGLLPRSHALELLAPAQWSLHLVNGSALFASLLLLLQGVAAAFLLVGRHSRAAAVIGWLLLVSAASRNPLAVTPADAYLIALLSFGMFLRWGRRWALDTPIWAVERAQGHHSVAACMLALQILALPLLYALHLWLQPAVPSASGALAVAIGIAIPVLALIPGLRGWPRLTAVVLYTLGALAVATGADFGALPWLALVSSLALLDSGTWQRLNRRVERLDWRLYVDAQDTALQARLARVQEGLALRAIPVLHADSSARVQRLIQGGNRLVLIDEQDRAHLDAQAVRKLLGVSSLSWPLRPLLTSERLAQRLGRWLLQAPAVTPAVTPSVPSPPHAHDAPRPRVLAALLILIGIASLAAQATTLRDPSQAPIRIIRAVLAPLALHHRWLDIGASSEPRWLAVVGEQADGRQVDALSLRDNPKGAPANYGPRQLTLAPDLRGRLYAQRLADTRHSGPRLALAQRLCRHHADRLARLRIVQVLPSASPRSAPAEQRVLLRHECRTDANGSGA